MRLSKRVIDAVEGDRFEVFYAGRGMTQYWNERKSKDELRYYTGWYWYVKDRNGKAGSDEHGPFKSRMAAVRDCYMKMQLRSKDPR